MNCKIEVITPRPSSFSLLSSPELSDTKSRSLEYELASEPLDIYVKLSLYVSGSKQALPASVTVLVQNLSGSIKLFVNLTNSARSSQLVGGNRCIQLVRVLPARVSWRLQCLRKDGASLRRQPAASCSTPSEAACSCLEGGMQGGRERVRECERGRGRGIGKGRGGGFACQSFLASAVRR